MKRRNLSGKGFGPRGCAVSVGSNANVILNPFKTKSSASTHLWNDNAAEMDAFISRLMSKMTLTEKIGQLDMRSAERDITGPYIDSDYEQLICEGRIGSLFNAYGVEFARNLQTMAVEKSRLGIPLLIGHDVIHGHHTIFPQSLGESASWEPVLVQNAAAAAAKEASADGIMWTFAPMADITRDPRWGRVSESSGEDVYLSTRMAVARVKGFQGEDLSKTDTVLATAKHFVGYGLALAGRDYHSTDVSEHELWTTHMPAFKAMVDAGVATFMTAFNDLNGIPATGSKSLLTDILRNQWGFEGLVVTDYTAINELVAHGFARDRKHAAEIAFNAGADVDMLGMAYTDYMEQLINEGKVSETQLDRSVRLILEMKWRLGLFDDPYRYFDAERAKNVIHSPAILDLSREVARRSMVLLKNDRQFLPLDPEKVRSIALIGPLADSKQDMIGNWSSAGDRNTKPVTVKEGLKARFGDEIELHYAKGATYGYLHEPGSSEDHLRIQSVPRAARDEKTLTQGIEEAVKTAQKSDVIVLVVGESWRMSGEASSRTELGLPGNQRELMQALKALGKPMVMVLMSGRPNDLRWEHDNMDAILHAWYPGTSGGHAVADVLAGDYNPSGKLPITFPRSVGQVPIYYNAKNTGRPYWPENPRAGIEHYKSRYDDCPNSPLYAFGHGLSYTRFEYSELFLSKNELKMTGDELKVSVNLTNIGDYAGEEVVQLYTRQRVGSVTRPVKELKGFCKLNVERGQSIEVTFNLTADDLAFYRADMSWGPEPGEFELFVGGASDSVKKASFTLV